ncbi:MAG: hypothetical protein RLZZ387_3789, partial [Chloroflexota bacterium]
MQSIVELMRRRTLLGAAAAIALGAYLLIRSFGAVAAPQSESPPADVVSLDLLGEEEALAPAAEGQEILAEAEAVIVYVSGAVVAPDVYRLPVSARVKDLVVAAGGLNADADA